MEKTAIELVAQERKEQIEKHGFTPEKDDKLDSGEMLRLANYIISADSDYKPEHWDNEYFMKVFSKPRIEQLSIAGAMVIAEMERLKRKIEHLQIIELTEKDKKEV